ncbi:VanW family protein [Selenihalanaerobacter shriftii]|uniref:Vancomycin resistance protein VanW n=1 Tax=Selenihalanaerobacter shriftii TaxID=142842 RepID=A0A1T4QD25_9FIRM|nr:VanW family protein [Selenihalanaerobacter shriftii]SKA01642.1 vancomycin resistance protein VanW [Selenihalanaerobacter shriftii]
MKTAPQILLVIFLLIVTIGAGAMIGAHLFLEQNQDVIFSGVRIEGYDFSGLNRTEAVEYLKEITEPILNNPIVLEGRNNSWLLAPHKIELDFKKETAINEAFKIGRRGNILTKSIEIWKTARDGYDIQLELTYNEKKLKDRLKKISRKVNSEYKNAYLDLGTGKVIDGKKGRKLNIKKSKNKIIGRLAELEDLPIRLVIEEKDARVNKEEVKKLGLMNQLSFYVTVFDIEDKNRVKNIKEASQRINGLLLMPGEVFSFNEVVGPRTLKAGFKEAIEIVNQEFVSGVGGGICQISSTLYNSVLLSNLKVVERQNHSRPVGYVSLGRGATVYYDYLDFKFKNNLSIPIMILSKVIKDRIIVSIMGESQNYEVQISTSEPEILEYKKIKKQDSSLKDDQQKLVREGRNGYSVVVKKRVLINGEVVNESIVSKDIYQPIDEVINVSAK